MTSVPITGAWECKWGWSPGSHTCASWARRLPLCRPCFQVCKERCGKKLCIFKFTQLITDRLSEIQPVRCESASAKIKVFWVLTACYATAAVKEMRVSHGCHELEPRSPSPSRQLQLILVWLRESDLLPSTTCRTDRIPWQRLRASPDRWSLSVHLASHISLSIRLAPLPDIKNLSCLCPFQTR